MTLAYHNRIFIRYRYNSSYQYKEKSTNLEKIKLSKSVAMIVSIYLVLMKHVWNIFAQIHLDTCKYEALIDDQ